MKTSEKLKALDAILDEAKRETVEAIGHDILQVLAQHGYPVKGLEPRGIKANGAGAEPKTDKKVWSPPPPGTDAFRVLKAIREKPGHRGMEVRKIAEGDGKPLHVKTLRTSLARLRDRGFIRQEEGRWYPAGQKHETAA
ncbi:MAG TPA: hypothetical protein VK430_06455 [Xanthobacteraceae bacterium]|nr:hypothetical protein [Xanthobacteraceae bacterium]